MQNIQNGIRMQQQELPPVFYDLGHHMLEETDEGGILIAEHGSSAVLFKEAVQLNQDETYHLFQALEARFQRERPISEDGEPCS